MLRLCWLILIVGCCSGAAVAAGSAARLTLLEGAATLHVGAQALRAAEGVPLPDGSLIDTDATCTLLRIEWPDGRALDLGPDSHAMLAPPMRPDSAAPAFYLLRGWAKYTSPAASHGWYSPLLDGAPAPGVSVLWVDAGRSQLFAESGAQPTVDRLGGRRRTLPEGAALGASPGRPAELLIGPSPAMLAGLPRAFRDTLPRRLDGFKDRMIAARPADPVDYAWLAPWLTAEPELRRDFPRRFAARLGEREFRAAVSANLQRHPEWAPLLAQAVPRVPPSGASR